MPNPEIINKVGFDFSWDVQKVWRLRVPKVEIPIKELEWHLEIPFLKETDSYDLKPFDVLDRPHHHVKEFERVQSADLSYPIDIMENKGRWVILDGLHRLMKSYIRGYQRVTVRKILRSEIPKILK